MMSTELPLSTRILLGVKPFYHQHDNQGSSCGCFTPLASSSEKTMSATSLLWCFVGGIIWTLLTCLCCDFLRDLKEPPLVGPPLIILISPIAFFGPSRGLSSSLNSSSDPVLSSCFGRPYMFFLKNFYSFPFWISSFIYSLTSLHSSV